MLKDPHHIKRTDIQHCETCRFYFATPVGEHGNCHRFPPNGSYGSGNVTTFPDNWCGEYRADKIKIDELGPGHMEKRRKEAEVHAKDHKEQGNKLRADQPQNQSTIATQKLK